LNGEHTEKEKEDELSKKFQIGNHWQPISNKDSFRTKQTDWWTVFIRMPDKKDNSEAIWKLIKSIDFSEAASFSQPKVNSCKADRNKNNYS